MATHLRQPHAATYRRAACARSSCLGRVCSVTSCITPHTPAALLIPTYKLRQGRAPMLSPNTEHMDALCASNCTTRHGYVQKSDDDRTADGDIAGSSNPAKHLALLPKAPVSFEPRCAPFCNMSVLCSEMLRREPPQLTPVQPSSCSFLELVLRPCIAGQLPKAICAYDPIAVSSAM